MILIKFLAVFIYVETTDRTQVLSNNRLILMRITFGDRTDAISAIWRRAGLASRSPLKNLIDGLL